MFAGLVSDIRKFHVFSSVWPEAEWAKDLPALEREVLNAPDRGGLLLALRHVSNSLRDGHLAFTPWGSNGGEEVVTLPVTFASAGDADPPGLSSPGRSEAAARRRATSCSPTTAFRERSCSIAFVSN